MPRLCSLADLAAPVFSLLLLACGGDSPPLLLPPPPQPTVSALLLGDTRAPDTDLRVGDTLTFVATAVLNDGTRTSPALVTWTTDQPSYLTLTSTGKGTVHGGDSLGARPLLVRASTASISATREVWTNDWRVERTVPVATTDTLWTVSLSTTVGSIYGPAFLRLSCSRRAWSATVGSGTITASGFLLLRFSGAADSAVTWEESAAEGYRTLSANGLAAQRFTARLLTSDTLYATWSRLGGGIIPGRWVLRGASRAVAPLFTRCD